MEDELAKNILSAVGSLTILKYSLFEIGDFVRWFKRWQKTL